MQLKISDEKNHKDRVAKGEFFIWANNVIPILRKIIETTIGMVKRVLICISHVAIPIIPIMQVIILPAIAAICSKYIAFLFG